LRREYNARLEKRSMNSGIIISCEHGGNQIPAWLSNLFNNRYQMLQSHRGWDPGALQLAERIVARFHCPFVFEKISRLVIDQNRSLTNRQVFSEITTSLSPVQRERIVSDIYKPYRTAISSTIENLLKKHRRVYHFSIHSFTPVLNGVTRNTDMGLLYDPRRETEKTLCLKLIRRLQNEIPDIRIRRNYPYKGVSDGLTTALRKQFSRYSYAGIEIEVNQLHVLGKTELWSKIMEKLPCCIDEVIGAELPQ
jgi:predicted N-formylglutamate amidohydrolase